MTRGRKATDAEAIREEEEGALAELGTARVYLRLINERVAIACETEAALMGPALEYLERTERLICSAQARIAARAGKL